MEKIWFWHRKGQLGIDFVGKVEMFFVQSKGKNLIYCVFVAVRAVTARNRQIPGEVLEGSSEGFKCRCNSIR